MGADREPDPDEGNAINYPSPGADAMDSTPFYHTRDDAHEQSNHTDHMDHLATDDQNGSDDHSRHPNLEELQLAAQLGQGMAANNILAATDPNMSVEDPNLRSIMPHPEPDSHHESHYVPDASVPEPIHQHPVPIPAPPQMTSHYSLNDGIPPRKRSKVSRACDECRRKKIKCDAQSDTGENPCSSCAKSSIRCLFSRVPQKRGPSKGYIKELADRINSIEHKLGGEGGKIGQEDLERLFAPERHRTQNSAGVVDDSSRKRPFSNISTGDFSTSPSGRHAAWAPEPPRQIHPAMGASDSFAHYDSSSLAPQPTPIDGDESPSRQPEAPMDVPMPDNDEFPEVDDGILHDYVAHIQPIYPVVPSNTSRLQSLLINSPSPVRTAFLNALLAVSQPSGGMANLASSLLHDWESSDAPRTTTSGIVHAQALILLIVEAGWRSSSTVSMLVARAVGVANMMKLWKCTSVEAASEPDSDAQLCSRIWWSLVLIDRWHALGNGKPVQIPESSVVIPPGLHTVVGDTTLYLLRLSKFLSQASIAISSLPAGASTTAAPIAAVLKDYVENFREDLPESIQPGSHPVVHLAYWHCRLTVTLLTPDAVPAELLWPLKELVTLLSANPDLRGPLTHHFTSLTAFALEKLSKLDSSRGEATQLAKDILDTPAPVWDAIRDRLMEQTREASAAEEAASHGLQHLANLATSVDGGELAGEGVPVLSLAQGYVGVEL